MLTINDRPAREINITCSLPRFLFAIEGLDLPGNDIYSLLSSDREQGKFLFLYLVGVKVPVYEHLIYCAWKEEKYPYTKEEWEKAKEIMEPVWDVLPFAWEQIIKSKTDWAFKVINKCTEKEIPILMHHDSVISADLNALEVCDIMTETWQEIFGDVMITLNVT